jgi:hypothetical protein
MLVGTLPGTCPPRGDMWVATLSVLVEVTCVFLVDSDPAGGVCYVCGVPAVWFVSLCSSVGGRVYTL